MQLWGTHDHSGPVWLAIMSLRTPLFTEDVRVNHALRTPVGGLESRSPGKRNPSPSFEGFRIGWESINMKINILMLCNESI